MQHHEPDVEVRKQLAVVVVAELTGPKPGASGMDPAEAAVPPCTCNVDTLFLKFMKIYLLIYESNGQYYQHYFHVTITYLPIYQAIFPNVKFGIEIMLKKNIFFDYI